MTADQRSLHDRLGVWETWSRHTELTEAADRAADRGDRESASALRDAAPDNPPETLDAVGVAADLVRLLSSGWVHAVDVAIRGGASWSEVGTASGCSGEHARAAHGRGSAPRLRDGLGTAATVGDASRWLTTAQAATRARRHLVTVRRAAGTGALHGHQSVDRKGRSVAGSPWVFHPQSVDAWSQGLDEPAQRQACGCVRPATSPHRGGGVR